MSKRANANGKPLDLATYQFDKSKYLQLGWGVVRDTSGKLVNRDSICEAKMSKTKKK